MIAAVFLAMPYAYRQGANIRVTFLVNRLGPGGTPGRRPRRPGRLHPLLRGLVFATFQQTPHVMTTGTTFVTLELPLWPAHSGRLLGLLLTTLMMLLDLREVRKGRSSLFRDG